jgi:hypothetical protein
MRRRSGWQEAVQRARALAAEADACARMSSGAPVDAAWLASAAGWLAEVAPAWAAMTGPVPTERSYRRLCQSPALEAWLICWPTGGRLQLHDHGGASGAFEIIEGTLEERSLRSRSWPAGPVPAEPPPDGLLGARLRHRLIGPGEPVAFDGGYIHDVRNTGGTMTTSVHVYGPALRPMAFYRLDGALIRTVELDGDHSLVETEAAAEGHEDRADPTRLVRVGSARESVAG